MAGNNGVDPVESHNAGNEEQGRPEWRDNMKKRRCGGGADTSSLSTAFEVLQRIQERGQMKDETQIEMMRIEAHFMGQDLDKLAPHLKEYYLSVQ
jgi:hypothetical protein